MNNEKIEKIINLAEKWNLDELEVEENGSRIRVVRHRDQPAVMPVSTGLASSAGQEALKPETKDVPHGLHAVRSPMVGIFLHPDQDAAAKTLLAGDHVSSGDVIGYVEAMKMRTELVSEVDGQVVEVLVTDKQSVEFNEPLFLVRPDIQQP
ncbi:biotin/lipoyl-containing protein [Desulfonatronospira sp.]|uniref:acetyl-CoA carboxylase biotin carboxyl carrier protein n=1 Tax=Desulfonatronospira sp. TaxID=1962951 RepID=UPI0025BB351A|nr:biotin/lipoyl-containing protein [Desulfonatronospira sp.]